MQQLPDTIFQLIGEWPEAIVYIRDANDKYTGLGLIKFQTTEATHKLVASQQIHSEEIGGFKFQYSIKELVIPPIDEYPRDRVPRLGGTWYSNWLYPRSEEDKKLLAPCKSWADRIHGNFRREGEGHRYDDELAARRERRGTGGNCYPSGASWGTR